MLTPSIAVDANDTGAGAREHGFGKAPATVHDVARVHDVIALRTQFLDHAIERFAEVGEIAFGLTHRNANVKIPG